VGVKCEIFDFDHCSSPRKVQRVLKKVTGRHRRGMGNGKKMCLLYIELWLRTSTSCQLQ